MAFEVVLKFRFDDILYPEGTPADDVIYLLTDECERLSRKLHADSVWIDDAYMTDKKELISPDRNRDWRGCMYRDEDLQHLPGYVHPTDAGNVSKDEEV